ncbi:hypothetical protein CORC01_10556 [Colletotrichum orchidophilum]|uniref:Uncharacterized protein n=1 Tax=Colletotrichum orchidophilum TaxID=1209926 RepID=A0A1G4AY60_9PEZI|nr:hypothetical protein CORC01_10556 [Colletotrichum orchidophilum]
MAICALSHPASRGIELPATNSRSRNE